MSSNLTSCTNYSEKCQWLHIFTRKTSLFGGYVIFIYVNTTKINCEFCKTLFDKSVYEITRATKIGRPMYCSLACGAKHAAAKRALKINNEKKYLESPATCTQCDKVLLYSKRKNLFCSHSCSAIFNEKIKEENREKKRCIVCSKILNGGKIYCSNECWVITKNKETERKIVSGEKVCHERIKKYVVKIRGNNCEECGWNKVNPKSGKCTVQLEHVDGNADNNELKNLKLLCPNCHSLTPTFGGLNRGNGRAWRYKK